jgi:molybdopterin synthase catalytic subunit
MDRAGNWPALVGVGERRVSAEWPEEFPEGVGARVEFLGIVRGEEAGEAILGIRYSAYESMVDELLERIVGEARGRDADHGVEIYHRLGMVPAGEASVVVRVQARHSAEAFELCRWYLGVIKERLPIWKEFVMSAGPG